ncbi:MAG TPA: hypothetical protein VNM91_09010 [Dehalococcoidia bacterium]|nr:hypothetical protein [Dehalococcoidia bacterium]
MAASRAMGIDCSALEADIEIADERLRHIASRHADLLPEYYAELIATIEDPNAMEDPGIGENELLGRWSEQIRGGRRVAGSCCVRGGEHADTGIWPVWSGAARRRRP